MWVQFYDLKTATNPCKCLKYLWLSVTVLFGLVVGVAGGVTDFIRAPDAGCWAVVAAFVAFGAQYPYLMQQRI